MDNAKASARKARAQCVWNVCVGTGVALTDREGGLRGIDAEVVQNDSLEVALLIGGAIERDKLPLLEDLFKCGSCGCPRALALLKAKLAERSANANNELAVERIIGGGGGERVTLCERRISSGSFLKKGRRVGRGVLAIAADRHVLLCFLPIPLVRAIGLISLSYESVHFESGGKVRRRLLSFRAGRRRSMSVGAGRCQSAPTQKVDRCSFDKHVN